MSNKTLVVNSETSFFDLCMNKLVTDCNVYCVFRVDDFLKNMMQYELTKQKGLELKVSPECQKNSLFYDCFLFL